MNEFIQNSTYFGLLISLSTYGIGTLFKKKWKSQWINPLLISIVVTIAFLVGFHVDYQVYNQGAKVLSYLLTPATICLAVPLYQQLEPLKKNYKAIVAGIVAGVLASLCCILAMATIFHLDRAMYVTFLPKSITTAIGMEVSKNLGGYVSITVSVIIITGILGSVLAPGVFRLLHITSPIAKGIALGSSSHAIGTTKALELGPLEGAMSSLSLVISGILTVLGANLFAYFIS